MTGPRPEDALLLACTRARPDAETLARIPAVAARVTDWERLLHAAEHHQVLPLLYAALNAAAPDVAPPDVTARLRAAFQENARINLFLTGELVRVLRLLEEHHVPAIPYKGPVLTAGIYGNLALRSFVDLDILVRHRDVLRAKAALVEHDFRPHVELTPYQELAFLRFDREYHFHRGPVAVEIHWEPVARYFSFRPDPQPLWDRLGRATLAGATFAAPAPEDLLLILCAHGAMHVWALLKWICDVAELIRAYPALDWPALQARAAALHGRRILRLGLRLAHDLLDAPLPPDVRQAVLADPAVAALAAHVQAILFADPPRLPGTLAAYGFYLRARERLRDRLAYAVRLALRPNVWDCRALSVPPGWFILYYLVRPARLLGTYVLGRGRTRS